MKIRNDLLKEIYFFSIYVYIISFYYLKIKGGDIFFKSGVIFSYICCVSLFFFIKHTKKEFFYLFFLIIVVLITLNTSLIPIILFSYFSKVIKDDKEFIKRYLIINLICYLGVIFLYSNNIYFLPQIDSFRIVGEEIKIRKSLGFSHPNAVFVYLIPIFLSYMYIRIEKWRLYDSLFIFGISNVLYRLTNSRTGFILNSIIIIYIHMWNLFEEYLEKIKLIKFFYLNLFTIMTTLSLSIGIFFHLNSKLNELLSLRPMIWYEYSYNFISNISILKRSKLKYLALDNSYLWILFLDGVLIWILYNYTYYKILKNIFYKKEIKIIVIYLLLYSLFENIWTSIYINPFFVIGMILIINKKESGE